MLKENAKRMLSGYYWVALGASFIVILLTGGLTAQFKNDSEDVSSMMNSYISDYAGTESEFNFDSEEDIENFINENSSAGAAAGEEMAEEFEKIFEEAFGDVSANDVESVL